MFNFISAESVIDIATEAVVSGTIVAVTRKNELRQ